jgi:type I restriction enzyme S subunit
MRSEWKEYKFKDVCNITSSRRIFAHEYCSNGIPFFRGKEIIEKQKGMSVSTPLFISEARYAEIANKYGSPQQGDILLTSVGTIGIPYVVKDERFYFKDGNLTWFRNYKGIDTVFLYYWLLSPIGQNQIESKSIGSTQRALTIDALLNFDILLPPLPEQRTIAEILSSLDGKIDLLTRQNVTLEALAQTYFRQWFVDAESNRDYRISRCVSFNPKRTLKKGVDSSYLEMANMNTNKFHPIKIENKPFISGSKYTNGDTLLARITPCLENGKACFVTFLSDNEIGWGSTEFIVMRPEQALHPFFAYCLAKNDDFRTYAEGCLTGSSGRQRIDIEHLKQFEISSPTNNSIALFNEAAAWIVPKLHNNYHQILTLQKLRNTLLPKLISGEVRVKQ